MAIRRPHLRPLFWLYSEQYEASSCGGPTNPHQWFGIDQEFGVFWFRAPMPLGQGSNGAITHASRYVAKYSINMCGIHVW